MSAYICAVIENKGETIRHENSITSILVQLVYVTGRVRFKSHCRIVPGIRHNVNYL
jgi:hypothetical protein